MLGPISTLPAFCTVLLTLLFPAGIAGAAAAAELPQSLDRDGDGFYDSLEQTLGADPADAAHTPESHAMADGDENGVADVCEDFLDNDGDGRVDAADKGCDEIIVSDVLDRGLDVFNTQLILEPGFMDGLTQELTLEGPVVIRRGEPGVGALPIEMVAMQVSGETPMGELVIIENPDRRSAGFFASESTAPPWRSEFGNVHALHFLSGEKKGEDELKVTNEDLPYLPPVQAGFKIDRSKCYKFPGGLHCPKVPVVKIPVLKWVAKFDCGEQPSTPPPFLGAVVPGVYATKIVIHNPQDVPVQIKKRVSQGLRNPKPGPFSPFEPFGLKPNETTEVDCPDIYRLLGIELQKGKSVPFINGVVVVVSQKKLDVIGNYTLEVPKEKVEFKVLGRDHRKRRYKMVTLVTEDTLIEPKQEVRRLLAQIGSPLAQKRIKILSDDIGVGASIDVEAIEPQKCILLDPPERPEGLLRCEP